MTLTVDVQIIPLKADQDGVMHVGETRVILDTVVRAFEQGHTAEEIASHYPALRLADVYAVIAYYLNNQPAVQAYLQRQEEETQKLWEQIESKADYQGFRQRLIARCQESRNSL
jgi:uncharacterized protein (DUF433 family)